MTATAAASGSGSISGAVTAPGHAKGDRIKVMLTGGSGLGMQELAQTYADAAGRYRFADLPAGGYSVSFLDTRKAYALQQYDGFNGTRTLTVRSGHATVVPKVAMTKASTIRGKVAAQGGGLATTDRLQIDVYQYSTVTKSWSQWYPWTSPFSGDLFDQSGNISVKPDGSYTVKGLAPGTYRVSAEAISAQSQLPISLETFYPGVSQAADATAITATAGSSQTRDITLRYGTTISGTVTAPHPYGSGGPAIVIYVLQSDGSWSWWGGAGGRRPDGSYLIQALPPGTYRLEFSMVTFQDVYYPSSPTLAGATDIVAAEGVNHTHVDVTMIHSAGQAALTGR